MITTEIPNKKVHIETWGCQMNVADSERMLAMLKTENYEITDTPEGSDLIILNTCHIREKARHKVISRLGVLRELKAKNDKMLIAVTGCVAQAEGKQLIQDSERNIDILIGPGKLDELPNLIKMKRETGNSQIAIGFRKHEDQQIIMEEQAKLKPTESLAGKNDVSRFVNIQQGCNNFCTFCVVPFTRGREISEHPRVILANIENMIKNGAREITLLGQNVNSYGLDLVERGELEASPQGPFYDILKSASQIAGLERLRFTTSNPHDFSDPLAELFAESPKLGKYIHLPVQSGSNRILSEMKRKVTAEEYMQRIAALRNAVPDMAISTDLIVGFPGETEEDFLETLELVKKVRFSFIFAFKYSSRKGTAAARFKNQIDDQTASNRLARLNEIQNQITFEENQNEISKTREVLFLYPSKKEDGIWYGRTPHFRLVRVASNLDLTGKIAHVLIKDANKTALSGELISE